jgi:hypothetical protein
VRGLSGGRARSRAVLSGLPWDGSVTRWEDMSATTLFPSARLNLGEFKLAVVAMSKNRWSVALATTATVVEAPDIQTACIEARLWASHVLHTAYLLAAPTA